MLDDDDILDENNDFNNINYQSRRGNTNQAQPAKKPAQQQQIKSDFNYNDIEFSDDDDILKKSIPKQQNNQKRGSDLDDFGFGNPSKNQSNSNQKQTSGLPPIQNNSGLPSINKPVNKQPISLDPFNNDDDFKHVKKKKESDIEDLDDLDDIYDQSQAKQGESPTKFSINKGPTEAIKSKPNFGKANIKQDKNNKVQEIKKNDVEEDYSESFDDDNLNSKPNKGGNYQKEEVNEPVLSSLSDLPDIEEQPSPKQTKQQYSSNQKQSNNYQADNKKQNSNNNYQNGDDYDDYNNNDDDHYEQGQNKESKPFNIQKKKQNDNVPSKTNLPPQPQKQPLRNRNDSADRQKSKNRENSADSLRRGSQQSIPKPANKKVTSREGSKNKIPLSSQSKSQPKTREPSAGRMFKMLNMKDLEKLLEDKNYDYMNFKDLKAENEALRDKLKQFNQQLTEKIEHNQPMIQKQAAQQNSSNQPRSRSTQMRTADAEKDNNFKIMKRLQEEYDKLEQRLQVVENQGYVSKLKQQIETAKGLINKFKIDIKHIILKNDQQAKELSKIERGDGIPDSVKESHNLKIEVQQYVDKINDLEKRKEEIEDMFSKKTELIELKDKELNEKVKEARQLNVDVNLQSNSYKRKEKFKELQKQLEALEKSNQTSIKLGNTKETIQKRELEEIQKEIQEKDQEINQMEIEIMEIKNRVQDRIDREKIYSRNIRDIFNRLPESEVAMHHHRSTDSIPRNKAYEASPTPVRHNNLVSPSSKQSSSSKPNLKFVKKDDFAKKLEKSNEKKDTDIIRDETETESINFHQKMSSKSNLNQIESDQKEEVISKPFNFKKNNQEARVWKPEENQNIQQQPSPQKQIPSNNNVENTPPSFNFKKKNEQQKENDPFNKPLMQNNQQPISSDNLNNKEPTTNQLDVNKEQEDVFSKPQKMFKFKKDNNENSNSGGGYNPVESLGQNNLNQGQQQQQKQEQIQPQKQEEEQGGYNFSSNSRVSRLRNKGHDNTNVNEQQQLSKIDEEKSKIASELKDDKKGGGYNPTLLSNPSNNNNNNLGGGYAFSGLQDNKNTNQNSMNNLSDSYQPAGGVSRRRGNPGASNNVYGEGDNINNNKGQAASYQPSIIGNNNLGGNNNSGGIQNNNVNNFNNLNAVSGNSGNQSNTNNKNIIGNDKQDELPINNAVSRRRGVANQQKEEDNGMGEYNFNRNQPNTNDVKKTNLNNDNEKWNWNTGNDNKTAATNNVLSNNNDNKRGNDNEFSNNSNNNNKQTNNVLSSNNDNKDNKWGWNSNSNDNNPNQLGNNQNKQAPEQNLNSFGQNNNSNQPVEQPKTFNFKKKQEESIVKEQEPILTNNQPAKLQQPPQQQQQQQPQQQKKADDDYVFQGPNDRRRGKKPVATEVTKVQKRDIFGSGDNEEQTFGIAAPKEVGGQGQSNQQTYQPSSIVQNNSKVSNKKSAFDDDDDTSGLDFLKQEKPKVNYNDDDDDLFGKKPSKQAQQPQSLGLGAKKPQEDKLEKEKKLASKAQNNDFFDDLF